MQSAKGNALVGAIHRFGGRVSTEEIELAATSHAQRAKTSHQLFWNNAPEALFALRVLDDGRFVFDDVNPAFRRLTGLCHANPAGRSPVDCLPADAAKALLMRCLECLTTGGPVEYDEVGGHLADARHWRTTLTPVKDPDTGGVFMLMGRLQDLTSFSRTPEIDDHSRRLLERIVETTPDVIYVFDLQTERTAFLSSRVREALGYSREYLQGLDLGRLLELIHPEDLPTVRQHMVKVRELADGTVATLEYRCRTGDGVYRWFRGKETIFSRTSDGRVEKVVGILSDIDRLKRARIAFTDMNARLTAILASISDCYLTIDHECYLTNVNSAAAKWLGKERDDVVGKHYREIFAGRAVQTAVRTAIREKRAVNAELPSQLHPGRWIDLHVYPAGDGVNIFFSDITKRKHAEAAAARSKALLNASIDALSAHIVILDAAGTIVASNKAWQRFAASRWRDGLVVGPGSNFLTLYEQAGSRSADIPEIATGVKSLLAGKRTSMRHIYHLGLGDGGRWYQLVAARFMHEGKAFAVLATEDVTDVREAKRALGELSERMLTLQDEERQRIAAELHDSTAQHLAAIGLNAMSLKVRSAGDVDTQKLWQDVEESLEEATRELRAFTYLLHPTRLESDGLNAALHRYVEGFAARTGLTVTVKLSAGIDDLPMSLRRSMLRIVQEALANVHRHASASRVSVKQKLVGNRLHLIVSDDGGGFKGSTEHGAAAAPLGVGIPGMRERLRQLGGNLEIKSGSRGTTVHVSVPFRGELRDGTLA